MFRNKTILRSYCKSNIIDFSELTICLTSNENDEVIEIRVDNDFLSKDEQLPDDYFDNPANYSQELA